MMLLWVLCVALLLGGLLASLPQLPTWRILWTRLVRQPAPVKVASARGQFLRYGPAAHRIPRAGPACTDFNSLRFMSDPSVR